jgi:quinol monooxygenase YgiN
MAVALPTGLEEGFSLHATVNISPDNLPAFLEAFKTTFDHVSKEEECLFFEMYQNPNSAGELSWVENWSKSPEWFMSVRSTVYLAMDTWVRRADEKG